MTANENDSSDQSLDQIENHAWGEAPAEATHLVATAHRLRRTPIKELTAADLRTLIAQRIGIAVLVPRVLPHLERDPLLEADYYPGDLLVALLRLPTNYWAVHPQQRARVEQLAAAIEVSHDHLQHEIATFHTGQ